MSSPYLEAAVMAERERDDALEEIDEVAQQRDEIQRELTKALEEIRDLRQECQRLSDLRAENSHRMTQHAR